MNHLPTDKMFLNSPLKRYIVHILVTFSAAFFPLEFASNQPTSKAILYGAIAAGCRAVLGAFTSTNPNVGKTVI